MKTVNLARAVGAALMLGATAVQAQPFARLNFEGAVNLQDQPGSGGTQLWIDFLFGPAMNIGGTPTGTVRAVPTIDPPYSSTIFPGITLGTIQDLIVDNTNVVGTKASPSSGLPITPFLTIGGYTFSLNATQTTPVAPGGFAFGPITVNPSGTRNSSATLSISGFVTGGAFGAGFIPYDGTFTAQFAGKTPTQVFNTINSGGQLRSVSFSAEFISSVPEPASVALLGTGLLALVGMTYRRRTNV